MIGNVFGNDRASRHDGIFPDGHALHDGGIGTDPRVLFDMNRRHGQRVSVFWRNGVPFGEQADFGSDEDAVLDGNPSEIQKNTVEVDEDVFPDFRMLPVIDVEWGKIALLSSISVPVIRLSKARISSGSVD